MKIIKGCITSFFFLCFSLSCFIGATNAQIPGDLMNNCNQWKINYPNGDEVKTLCVEDNNEFYYVNDTGDAIVFRAPIRSDNGTTPNSSYIRSELRERKVDGSSDIYWTTEGTHVIYVKQAITHLPINKSHLVATQIHGNKDDGIDDSMVLRLEDSHLFLSFNGGKLRDEITIKTDYDLGTLHEVIFIVNDGKHYCYYSEDGNLLVAYNNGDASAYLVKDGGNDYVMDLNYDETYFKIGNYTQSNAEREGSDTDDPSNYGEVVVYDFFVEHETAPVSGVVLSPSTLNLSIGGSYQLIETIIPTQASNKEVRYSSSDSDIVQVSANGFVFGMSAGSATITVTTDEGNYEATSLITVLEEPDGPNLALEKSVSGTGSHDGNNVVENLVDGFTSTRWSVSGYPQTATIDLGEIFSLERTELVCYENRAYQYTVSVSTAENGTYTQIVDRSQNVAQGTESNPIVDLLPNIEGQFIKITVTGAENYEGPWVSLLEFRAYGESLTSTENYISQEQVFIWPNPSNNLINLKGVEEFETLTIFDQMGKLVLKQSTIQSSIDISNLVSGLYVLKLANKQKTINHCIIKK